MLNVAFFFLLIFGSYTMALIWIGNAFGLLGVLALFSSALAVLWLYQAISISGFPSCRGSYLAWVENSVLFRTDCATKDLPPGKDRVVIDAIFLQFVAVITTILTLAAVLVGIAKRQT